MADRKKQGRHQGKRQKDVFYDYGMLFIILFLVGFGLIMIYSTSYYSATIHKNGDSMYYLKRQGLLAAVGVVLMLLISKMDYRWVLKPIPRINVSWVVLIYLTAVILQTYVLFFGVDYNGAKRWISLGPLGTFQPSDLSKAAAILMIAYMVNQKPRALDSIKGFIAIAIPIGLLLMLIAVENMSTAIVMGLILLFMCYVASRKLWYFLLMGAAGAGLGALYILLGEGFRMERVQIWLNVETHEKGGQILQGLYAIASGGAFGKGLGQSMQKLGYVPEAQNDMIFSIICEELGMFGAFAIMLVFILLFWHILQIAMNAPDLFGGMLCSGVLIHVASQVLLNIAVVTNSIPSTGVALPFISYGGTSVMILLAEMGIVLSVSNRIK